MCAIVKHIYYILLRSMFKMNSGRFELVMSIYLIILSNLCIMLPVRSRKLQVLYVKPVNIYTTLTIESDPTVLKYVREKLIKIFICNAF